MQVKDERNYYKGNEIRAVGITANGSYAAKPSLFFRFRKSGLKSAVKKMFLKMAFMTEWFIGYEGIKTIS